MDNAANKGSLQKHTALYNSDDKGYKAEHYLPEHDIRRRPMMADESLNELKVSLRGMLLVPGQPGYDEARTLHNAMIDKHPAMIVRCAVVARAYIVCRIRFRPLLRR